MTLLKSWVCSANSSDTDFPLNNLPYGVFSTQETEPRCGVAIGNMIFDCQAAEEAGFINFDEGPIFDVPYWNEVMELGPDAWTKLRTRLVSLLTEGAVEQDTLSKMLTPMSSAELHLPLIVAEYTDFYAGRNHATNVGTMFRGAENALPPNWLHIPIGYNGRASSVVVSGTDIRRPWGQLKSVHDKKPHFAPCQRFDFELEIGAIVGTSSDGPVSVCEADDMIFGYVILNDWSARDIQAWEYQPLGPFQAKATATTISPWIVTKAALEPFRCDAPEREFELLPHLKDKGPMLYSIDLVVSLTANGQPPHSIVKTNYREMYYSSAQQLAHHSSAGCPMNSGDLLGSGTISGNSRGECGSMLELSWGGKEPLEIDTGVTRSFLEDGDGIEMTGFSQGNGYKIGFGSCFGTVIKALRDPYAR
ncbi:MAG: fumarylacetoacetase [Rhodobacteraceae bacterium]|nr:fumarylacetoacetase [Paracoccaceae bacterium]